MSDTIDTVAARHMPRLMALDGVVGVGQTLVDGRAAVAILVRALTPALAAALPATLDGFPVRVDIVGAIRPSGAG